MKSAEIRKLRLFDELAFALPHKMSYASIYLTQNPPKFGCRFFKEHFNEEI